MNLNLNTLQTFLAIVETGSLVRASKALHVTQSTVTARLKSLEEEVGQALIYRHKSGARLTASGVRLKRYAETMTGLWRQAKQETALPETVSVVCNIGCDPDLWPHRGQALFDAIRQRHPDTALSVWQGDQERLEQWLNNGLIDMALTYRSTLRGEQTVHALPDDQLVLVSTRASSPVRFDPDYVFVEAGDDFGQQHAAAFADADTARMSFGNGTLGLEYLLRHGGSAYIAHGLAEPHIASGELHQLTGAPVFARSAYLVLNQHSDDQWVWLTPLLGSVVSDSDPV